MFASIMGVSAGADAFVSNTWNGVINAHAIDSSTWSKKATEYPATPIKVFVNFDECLLTINGKVIENTYCKYGDFVMGTQKWYDPSAGYGKGTISISTYSVSKRTGQIEYTESLTSAFMVHARAGIEKIDRYTMPEYDN